MKEAQREKGGRETEAGPCSRVLLAPGTVSSGCERGGVSMSPAPTPLQTGPRVLASQLGGQIKESNLITHGLYWAALGDLPAAEPLLSRPARGIGL